MFSSIRSFAALFLQKGSRRKPTRPADSRRKPRSLQFEALEYRQMLSNGLALNTPLVLGPLAEFRVAGGASGGNPSASAVSLSGVQYASGQIDIQIASLTPDALGSPWSPSLDWSSQLVGTPGPIGDGVAQSATPQLLLSIGSSTLVLSTGAIRDTFMLSGSTYSDFEHNTMTDSSGYFTLLETSGNTEKLYDFTGADTSLHGMLSELKDAAGNTTTFSYTSDKLTSVDRSATIEGTTTTEDYTYTYSGSHVTSISTSTGITENFTYYNGTCDHTDPRRRWGSRIWQIVTYNGGVIDATYLRYNGSGQVNYAFQTGAYLRLLGSIGDVGGGVTAAEGITGTSAARS